MLFWLVAVVCINDIAAFFTGRALGGPKLAPVVSPKKTWAGSCGGLVGGIVAGVSLNALLPTPLSIGATGFVSLAVVLAAQLGDLSKSLIKRVAGVKDSGSLLPGHGGMLDRLDGILGGAPVFLLSLLLCQSSF